MLIEFTHLESTQKFSVALEHIAVVRPLIGGGAYAQDDTQVEHAQIVLNFGLTYNVLESYREVLAIIHRTINMERRR